MVSSKHEEAHVEVEQPEQREHASPADHIAVHTQTFDISEAALGHNLSSKYFWSPRFMGIVFVSCLYLCQKL